MLSVLIPLDVHTLSLSLSHTHTHTHTHTKTSTWFHTESGKTSLQTARSISKNKLILSEHQTFLEIRINFLRSSELSRSRFDHQNLTNFPNLITNIFKKRVKNTTSIRDNFKFISIKLFDVVKVR
jgi:hypothetical protein